MGMNYYAIDSYGIVIDENGAKRIIEYMLTNDGKETRERLGWAIEELKDYPVVDLLTQLSDYGNICGEIVSMVFYRIDGILGEENINCNSTQRFVLLPIKKYPSLYNQAYKDFDEIVAEATEKYGWLFPKNYPIKDLLCNAFGVEVG